MRTLQGEAVLNISATRAWTMYRDNQIIGKINPSMLSHATYIQGKGDPGSLRLLKLGPAVSSYVKESTEKIEKVEAGKSVTYQVVDGDLKGMYKLYRVTFSFAPVKGNEGNMCIASWKAEFDPITPMIPPPEKARDAALGFLKSFERYQLSY